jgi:hypothetical protein
VGGGGSGCVGSGSDASVIAKQVTVEVQSMKETEGTQAGEAGMGSLGEGGGRAGAGATAGIWSIPMYQERPYPSQARLGSPSSSGQQSQSMAWSSVSGVILMVSQYECITCHGVRAGYPRHSFQQASHLVLMSEWSDSVKEALV